MSFGGASEKSSANMNSTQNIWGGQSSFLESLYNSAQGLFGQQQGPVWANSTGLAQEGLAAGRAGISGMQNIAGGGGAGMNALGQIMGGRGAGMNALGQIAGGGGQGMAQLLNLANTGGPVGQYANPNNALAREQLSQMSQNIGDNFQRNVMPALNSAAGLAGGMGGSRNAIGRGLAASDAQSQIAQAGTNLYGQQYGIGAQAANAATQARLGASQAYSQARLGAGQAYSQMQLGAGDAYTQSQMGAAGQLPGMGASLYNLGMSPFTAQWAPMTALASMIGSPTTLTTAESQQKSSKKQFNFGFS